ncbi:hypothetical protein HYFRA_00003092 [Hymenoscyphus fraxineus]|uniref:GAF domain-containing protein n=1 Tax=Hymenoscyphus fraxineus TaxID=746836 RepID=A0A9N9KN40_9HELO|nr:hypothetical protein HYFRA_00003092 [Hymenoscyphus fraxineus]
MAPKMSKSHSSLRDGKLSIRNRLFGRKGSEDHYHYEEVENEEGDEAEEEHHHHRHEAFERPQRLSSLNATSQFPHSLAGLAAPPPGVFSPASYVNPLVHKMAPRVEVPPSRPRAKHIPLPVPGEHRHPQPSQLQSDQPHTEGSPSQSQSQSQSQSAHPHSESRLMTDKPLPDPPAKDNGPVFPPPQTRRQLRKLERELQVRRNKRQRPRNIVMATTTSDDTSSRSSVSSVDPPATLPSMTQSPEGQHEQPAVQEVLATSTVLEPLPDGTPIRTAMQEYEEHGHLWDVPADLRDSILAGEYDNPDHGSPDRQASPDNDYDSMYDVSDDGRGDRASIDTIGPQTFHLAVERADDIPDTGVTYAYEHGDDNPDAAATSGFEHDEDIPDPGIAYSYEDGDDISDAGYEQFDDIPDAGVASDEQVDDISNVGALYDFESYQLPGDRREAISKIAQDAAKSEGFVGRWEMYLSSYSSGHYVVSNPPPPPPRNDALLFLPAVKALNDRERLMNNRMFQPLWERWEIFKPKFALLVLRALERFDIPGVAVSLFDEDTEFFAVERGMGINGKLPRSVSMAAHVLYSIDPVVILDTHKDWRFAGNPLVTGPTDIRFFAATPLLTHNTQTVGVLSIFDSQPRENFTPRERQELQTFANRLLTNLSQQVLFMTSQVTRHISRRQVDTSFLDQLASRPASPESDGSRGASGSLYPPLRIPSKGKSKFPPLPANPGDGSAYNAHQFPPLPSIPRTRPRTGGSVAAQNIYDSRQFANPNLGINPQQQDVVALDSGNHQPSNRPWTSGFSTTGNAPPNTSSADVHGDDTSRSKEFTVEEFMSLTDENLQEPGVQDDPQDDLQEDVGFVSAEFETSSNFRVPNVQNYGNRGASYRSSPDFGSVNENETSLTPFPALDDAAVPAEEAEQSKEMAAPRRSPSNASVSSYNSIPLLQRGSTLFKKGKKRMQEEEDDEDFDPFRNSESYDLIPPDREMNEADQLCWETLSKMRYDIVYVVEIIPPRYYQPENEYVKLSEAKLRVLGSSSRTPLELVDETDAKVHLEALRTRGCFGVPTTTLMSTSLKHFQYGVMAGIQTEPGPLRLKTAGIVVAALRERNTMYARDEEETFMNVSESFKALLIKKVALPPSRIPRISSTSGR